MEYLINHLLLQPLEERIMSEGELCVAGEICGL